MAYVTRGEAIRAAQSRFGSGPLMETELRKSARTPSVTHFDIFLSHSREDVEVIAGIKALLENDGLSVYVDWLDDPRLDRSHVTAATAEVLRSRMNHCGYLLYGSSRSSSNSKWMPWELGYFDGRRPGKVGILPVVASPGDPFVGVEYLGLYPLVERVRFTDLGTRFGRYTGPTQADVLKTMAKR
jgi:TIR domain